MKPPHVRRQQTIREILQDPRVFGTTLVVLLLDTYDTEALTWAPETIKQSLEEDFQAKIPEANFDRLMAAITILTTNRFTRSEADFIQLCNVLSGDSVGTNQFDPADLLEIAWGLTEWYLLVGSGMEEDSPDDEFSPAILDYIAAQAKQEGLVDLPDVLKLASSRLPVNTIAEFQDDPTMFSAVYVSQKDKQEEIETALRESLDALLSQLTRLPLINGDTQNLRKGILNDQSNQRNLA